MIHDDWARPIVKTAAKAFEHHYDPNKPTFQLIFHNHWEAFLAACKKKNVKLPQFKIDEVERMMACGTLDMGFEIYECPNCHRHHIICYTCKSRFCPSCGSKATRARAFFMQTPAVFSYYDNTFNYADRDNLPAELRRGIHEQRQNRKTTVFRII